MPHIAECFCVECCAFVYLADFGAYLVECFIAFCWIVAQHFHCEYLGRRLLAEDDE
jgi:hypothetical protein